MGSSDPPDGGNVPGVAAGSPAATMDGVLSSKKVTHIILDLDGTLLDTGKPGAAIVGPSISGAASGVRAVGVWWCVCLYYCLTFSFKFK